MSHPFAQLLAVLGRQPDEQITVAWQSDALPFAGTLTAAADAPELVASWPQDRNVWFSVQPIKPGVRTGKAKASDVAAVVALYADLDIKAGALPDLGACFAVVADLAAWLGSAPAAIVVTGHGAHPYWRIERTEPVAGAAVLKRWGDVVAEACARHGGESGGKRDGVYNLDRIMRVPGTTNVGKLGKNMDPVPVTLILGSGATLELADVQRRLDAWSPTEAPKIPRPSPTVREDRADEDRVFTDEAAARYIEAKALGPLRSTPEGAGFNNALNEAAFTLSAFVPEFYDEDHAVDMLIEAIGEQFPGGPNREDYATMRSGLGAAGWYARRPTEEERADPFSAHYDGPIMPPGARNRPREPRNSESAPGSFQSDARPDDAAFLTEEFWATRRVFAHLRQVAHSAMESPEGVLVAALALTLAQTMPNVVLPAAVGTEASLNLMFVLIGDPGDGKSVCRKLADKALKFEGRGEVDRFGPSSGQGIAGQYQVLRKRPKEDPKMERTKFNAVALVDESDTIKALSSGTSNTLSSELRKASMGEDLGFGNVGETKTNLPEHSYRFVLFMCMQPELAGWLLDDSAGGLPQRFLWVSVRDPRIVEGVEYPGQWTVRLPFEANPAPATIPPLPRARFVMEMPEEIRAEVVAARVERKKRGRAAGKDFDGHAILTRLKVTAAFALLDGRSGMTNDDWALAGQIMRASDAARAWTEAVVEEVNARKNEQLAKARGHGRVIEETVVSATARERCMERTVLILKSAGAEGINRAHIQKRLSAAQRDYLGEVLDELLASERVKFIDLEGTGQTGSKWYLQ